MKIRAGQIDAVSLAEFVRDTVADALASGTGITVTVNDPGDTITITGVAAYTDEQARDAVAAALVAGTGLTITPNDLGDTITVGLAVAPVGLPKFWDDVLTVANAAHTTLTLGETPISRSERIWHGQTLLDRGTDYTIAGRVVTLLVALVIGDEIRDYYAMPDTATGAAATLGLAAGAGTYTADYEGTY